MSLLQLPRQVPTPSPSEVMGYLRQGGWKFVRKTERWSVFGRTSNSEVVELDIPLVAEARDYSRAVGVTLEDLERLEQRPAGNILRDILASANDLVRLSLKGPAVEDGRVDIDAGAQLHASIRELVLAAACAAIDTRPVYARRKPEKAMEHLRRARFAPSEIGSYVLVVETPIPPVLQTNAPASSEPEPFERRVGIFLSRGLYAAREAANEAAVSGSLEPFTSRVSSGVSANLCEAISTLVEVGPTHTLSVDFGFASSRPASSEVQRRVQFAPDHTSILREAAAKLRAQTTLPDLEMEGPIHKLESANPDQGGEAIVLANVDGKHHRVRVRLGAADYQLAVDAHGERQLVRGTGELVKEGAGFRLQNPRGFGVVAEDEE